ncbi:MAG: sugar transferase [Clostridium sp.]|nr:sugar transferase [Clostridium sp.]
MKKEDVTKSMRWEIADRLAEERLEHVNKLCKEVHFKETIYTKYVKRGMDICFSALVLPIILPINLVIGVITFFDMGRPIFFHQQRVGKNGKIFEIVKFRNLRNLYDRNGELLPVPERMTKFGHFMRKSSLDELLNFWYVLKGDMSLIGPRPLVPEYEHRYNKRHKMRTAVRPGLECPSREKVDGVRTWQYQLENDIWYVENVSFLTDIKLAFRLVSFLFNRKNAEARAGFGKGVFMGYDWDGNAITLDDVPQEYMDYYDTHSVKKFVK